MAIRPQSSELTGGSGFTFEDGVSAQYLAGLLFEGSMPGLPGHIITRVALQQAAFGEPLDDLIVDGTANDGSVARLSLQIKRSLNIGAGTTDFREIIGNSWKTLKKTASKLVATGSVSLLAPSQTIVCGRCRLFVSGRAPVTMPLILPSASRLAGLRATITVRSDRPSRQSCWKPGVCTDRRAAISAGAFLAIKCDALHEGASSSVAIINQLTAALSDTDSDRGHDLWDALQQIAHEQSGRSAAFQRPNLLTALKGRFRFRGSNRLQRDLLLLERIAAEWPDDIGDRIGGVAITRPKIQAKLDRAIADHRFVQIQGRLVPVNQRFSANSSSVTAHPARCSLSSPIDWTAIAGRLSLDQSDWNARMRKFSCAKLAR